MHFAALVPMRHHSQRVPGKNYRLLAGKPHVQAQNSGCPTRSASASDDRQPSGPEVSMAEVTFSGSLQLPLSDQDQIAASIKRQDYGISPDGATDDAVERVSAGWQDHEVTVRQSH